LAALKAELNIEASGQCSGNSCEGKASASCAMSPAGSSRGTWLGFGLLGVVTAGLIRRRVRKSA
jgi:MYXO-CTERM domain-containing protein